MQKNSFNITLSESLVLLLYQSMAYLVAGEEGVGKKNLGEEQSVDVSSIDSEVACKNGVLLAELPNSVELKSCIPIS